MCLEYPNRGPAGQEGGGRELCIINFAQEMVVWSIQTERQTDGGALEKQKIEEISGEHDGEFIGTAVTCRCLETGKKQEKKNDKNCVHL